MGTMEPHFTTFFNDFSLELICKVKVTSEILLACETKLDCAKEIELEATKRVNKLFLPVSIKREIQGLIRPISEELRCWYRVLDRSWPVRPMWTANGTADITMGARHLLKHEKKVNNLFRFILACATCNEKYIFKTGLRLKSSKIDLLRKYSCMLREKFKMPAIWFGFAHFWLNVPQDSLSQQSEGNGPLHLTYFKCLELALAHGDDFTAKCYIKKATYNALKDATHRHMYHLDGISPSTLHSLVLRLGCGWHFRYMTIFRLNFVPGLINWPYQRFYAEAARCLVAEGSGKVLLTLIADKIVLGYADYDYHALFTEVWKICLGSKKPRTHVELANHAFKSQKAHLIKLVVSEMCKKQREDFLRSECGLLTCCSLLTSNNFQAVDLLVRCGTHDLDLLLDFELEILESYIIEAKMAFEGCRYSSTGLWNEERYYLYYQFTKIIDSIVAEKQVPRTRRPRVEEYYYQWH